MTRLTFVSCVLALVLGAAVARAGAPSLVRLYFIPTAPAELKWSSPRALLLTTIESALRNKSHPIGHVAVEIQLRGSDEAPHHVFTGATDLKSGMGRRLLLEDGLGFSVLERAWPGRLEDGTDTEESVRARSKHRDRLAVATFLISDAACERLLAYHRALEADPRPRYYGFGARPRRGEGSGCSAFGASFLEQIGALDAGLRAAWSQSVRAPLALMAGYQGNGRIGLARLLTSSKAARWASESEPHMFLEFFDPDLMFAWAMRMHAQPAGGVQRDLELPKLLDRRYQMDGLAERNVKAVVVDMRAVPVPAGPIFLGEPALKAMDDTSIPTVVRSDKVVGPDGSFEIRP